MEITQKQVAERYLTQNYFHNMTGSDLSKQLNIPQRSARRYLRTYRESLDKNYPLASHVQPMYFNGVVFDIETTNFGTEGYGGYCVCCSFLELDSDDVETIEIRFEDQRNDARILKEIAKKLAQYTLHVGHNIAAYDYNWLNTKLSYYRLPNLDTAFYLDTYQVAKSLGIKTTKSLGNLIDYYQLEGTKTTIYKTSWSQVMSPTEAEFDDALDEISEHCELDVRANRELLHRVILPDCISMRTNPLKVTKRQGNYWKYQP
jgi:uncharacterized protein YprB with RNaseH-like and TPR domain